MHSFGKKKFQANQIRDRFDNKRRAINSTELLVQTVRVCNRS